jgi:hypothetical protein
MARNKRCVHCPEPAFRYLLCRQHHAEYMAMRAILDARPKPVPPQPARVGRTRYGGRVTHKEGGHDA